MKQKSQQRRTLVVFAVVLVALMALSAMVIAAPSRVLDVTDGPTSADANYSHRLIVQLESPSLAEQGLINIQDAQGPAALSPAAQSHMATLQSEQAAFVSAMQNALPSASVSTYINESGQEIQATYQVVFNGVAVDPGNVEYEQAYRTLAQLPGVKGVYRDYRYTPDVYASTQLINAPVLWDGDRENAGAGINFASMDGGVHHDAPMFDGTGYSYPPGYPLGDTQNTNGKIIVSRAYFRSWDPPAPGDENTWPGENGTPHGVHTASTAAGNVVTDATYAGANVGTLSGVAPGAYVMSYRMFYASVSDDGSFYTVEGIAALEDIVNDGAEVLNNSWGGGPGSIGGEFDPLDAALINASEAGVFIAMSAGNAGPGMGTGDHPSDHYINVAATTSGGAYATGALNVSAPDPVPSDLEGIPFIFAAFGSTPDIGQLYTYDFVSSTSVDPANYEGCEDWPANAFDGKAVLISRGTCEFGTKVLNAEEAGADFVIIYNNAGDELISMGAGVEGGAVTISSIFIGQTAGDAMVDWYDTHGDASELEMSTVAEQVGNDPDVVADFSSRGPGAGNVLKPDIAAPGVNILAQGYTPGATGEARHLGYGQSSGTSMAAPHVAGAAVLLKEIHSTWTNAEIKSALMSTSQYLDVYNADGSPAQPLDIGAGRLDLTHAADPGVILDPPSLSFGQMITGEMKTISVTVTSVATATETYALSTLYTGDGFESGDLGPLPGFTLSDSEITLDPGEDVTIQVTFDSSMGMGLGENQGYIIMEGDEGHHAHMPAWARVAAPDTGQVLLIDNDFSFLLGFPEYRNYYTEALDDLGVDYAVWHADAYYTNPTTIPPAAILASYDAVIYFSGDNYQPDGTFTVSTPLTNLDMDAINEYVMAGGSFIVMGQDASWVLNDSFLQGATLGVERISDSVTNFALPDRMILPRTDGPQAFWDVVLDLTGPDNFVGSVTIPDAPPSLGYDIYMPFIAKSGDDPGLADKPTGEAQFAYDIDSGRLDYEVTVNVTDPVTLTASHIHDGTYGIQGPVMYTLFMGEQYITDTYTFSGAVLIDPGDVDALMNGETYINLHTTDHPASAGRAQIWLVEGNDGANNQYYIDEIETFPGLAPEPVPGQSYAFQPFLYYPGPYNVEDGTVAMLHRDNPTLEYPGQTFPGRAAFTGFGLEGVNNTATTTSRSEFLGTLLAWAMDEPMVTISNTSDVYDNTSLTTMLQADFSSNLPDAHGVWYRWDFGDGSPYTSAYESNVAGHDYATCGTYTVRVEATDNFGHSVIGEEEIEVTNCATPFPFTPGGN